MDQYGASESPAIACDARLSCCVVLASYPYLYPFHLCLYRSSLYRPRRFDGTLNV